VRIGELAKASKLGVETIRFYDRLGLFKTHRGENGYRIFDEDSPERARFVQQAKELGFTLSQIKELMDLRLDPSATRREVRTKSIEKVKEIELKINQLQGMRRALTKLIESCQGQGAAKDCPILEGLQLKPGISFRSESPGVLRSIDPHMAQVRRGGKKQRPLEGR
jgi:MerR family copper efflux transcriptional regulator